MKCCLSVFEPSRCDRPVAVWKVRATGFAGPLCRTHLNIWLDTADNEPELEPDELEFLWKST